MIQLDSLGRCDTLRGWWTAGGRWKWAETALYFGLTNKEGPLRNEFAHLPPHPSAVQTLNEVVVCVSSGLPMERGVLLLRAGTPCSSCKSQTLLAVERCKKLVWGNDKRDAGGGQMLLMNSLPVWKGEESEAVSDAVSRKQQEGSQARRIGGPGMHLVQVPKCLSFCVGKREHGVDQSHQVSGKHNWREQISVDRTKIYIKFCTF